MMADIARVNPGHLPDPHRRRAAAPQGHLGARGLRPRRSGSRRCSGTNGVLLREREARLMRDARRPGRLDQPRLDRPAPPRRVPPPAGRLAGRGAGDRGAPAPSRARLLAPHVASPTGTWARFPAMIDLARELGATRAELLLPRPDGPGRGAHRHRPRRQYERDPHLSGASVRARAALADGAATGAPLLERREDPWCDAGGPRRRPPDPRQVRAALPADPLTSSTPRSPLLAELRPRLLSRPASTTAASRPTGDVTPCPYMPVAAGNLRETGFAELWRAARRSSPTSGEPSSAAAAAPASSREICGGCRCRAYATYGDYLAEDPACALPAGRPRGRADPARGRADVRPRGPLRARRGSPPPGRGSTRSPRSPGRWSSRRWRRTRGARATATVTPALLAEVRSRWGISPGRPFTPASGPAPRGRRTGEPAMAARDEQLPPGRLDLRRRTASSTGWAASPSPRRGLGPRGMERGGDGMVRRRRAVRARHSLAAHARAWLVRALGPVARDFARILTAPGRASARSRWAGSPGGPAPGPWLALGVEVSDAASAPWVFCLLTVVTALMLGRAAWSRDA